jgi:pimeloyl-ACP methyl ester carboxylesterase
MADLAADVIAFMDVKGIERATVVGHSMGSFVAQQVVAAAPERVARLVLIASTTTPRNVVGISDLARAVDSLVDPVPPEFAREFQVSTIYHPVPEEFLDEAVAVSLKLPARVWREIMAGMLATGPVASLGQSGIPTLILWGDRDSGFPRSEQEALLAAIPGAELKVYPETGHALHWERPAEFVRDLEAFLARS